MTQVIMRRLPWKELSSLRGIVSCPSVMSTASASVELCHVSLLCCSGSSNHTTKPMLSQKRWLSSTPSLWKHRKKPIDDEEVYDHDDVDVDDAFLKNQEIIREIYKVPGHGARVFVVHPDVKWGPKKNYLTTGQLQLDEAVALAETLPNWKAVEKVMFSTKTPNKKTIFGRGNFEEVTKLIRSRSNITAVLINVDQLTGVQHTELENAFGVPVYDRYSIVLQIFVQHAKSKEAKLQIALAEIPYIRSRLHDIHKGNIDHPSGKAHYVGGPGETYYETRHRLLKEREAKIRKALEKVSSKRQVLKQNRLRREIPTVAVVGYTNAGKTSLIKAVTGAVKLEPREQLFATLDVTAHAGALPNRMNVVYIDTVGFISDIPTSLIGSFRATLEDLIHADLVLHVRDISHPDTVAQKENVMQTLMSLKVGDKLMDNMIEVCNKCDLLKGGLPEVDEGSITVSALHGTGLDSLLELVEDRVMLSTGKLIKSFLVANGGKEFQWLYKEASVDLVETHSDPEYLVVTAILSQSSLSKYMNEFGKESVQ
ncbi:PREDICTED: putative GTP-binding protein 6 [Priapulus caudatus]|uniref:GTP-binding protein 6 n=1 Tax=Priapulus caudatus TaxID=37621 RepID=A0ABM1FAU6_PRICU|nr:PREDICTED: putative GTP-binding protein 6 [Priapulus caudatus]XP_014681566.1 PREDICTED: putative GTP-binding protein 6 [Priapulus caudatus]XP_014681567.1 PREDICTED: putative GTP-binding protein 6 [Priapulus caudatus]XP_014681568.1 PREDICTED: putative GTP-binding protein 6 [Priapulus caudatus]